MLKKVKNCLRRLASSERMKMLAFMLLVGTTATFAQSAAGDYTQGTAALTTVTEEIAKYVPYVVKLCYAIAGVVAVVGAISVYIKMNNEEQDVKKSIMMIVGACIFLVAAAQETAVKVRDHWKEAEKSIHIEVEGLSRNSLFQSETFSVCTDITGNSVPT